MARSTRTRLGPDAYLAHLRADGVRLAEVAASTDLARPVPTCPGWSVLDAVVHTGMVFAHKTAIMRLGRRPEADEWSAEPAPGQDPVTWYRAQLDALTAELATHDPAAGCPTWDAKEETFGFWYRRMAQEVAIHRLDVEDGAGVEPLPIDPTLALDGTDELLSAFVDAEWGPSLVDDTLYGQRVVVNVAGTAWTVALERDRTYTRDGAAAASDATLTSGDPETMLLYLWGRRDADTAVLGMQAVDAAAEGVDPDGAQAGGVSAAGVTAAGDAATLIGFRRRLYLLTSD